MGNNKQQQRSLWTRDQLLLALRIYCRLPFGKLNATNPRIIELAKAIGRTPAAVSMKACNFASLDPVHQQRGVAGLKHGAKADRELWDEFMANSTAIAEQAELAFENLTHPESPPEVKEPTPPDGPTEYETTIKARRVQRFFRAAVLTSYGNRCALTGIPIPDLLVASHIIPWSVDEKRRADPTNGILLNALHDRAFDLGYLTFDEDNRALISPQLRIEDPPEFYRIALNEIHGQPLAAPARFAPDPDSLNYHRDIVFRS